MSTARSAFRTALVDQATTAYQPVQVAGGWPGDELERESVFLGSTRGPMSIPVFGGLPVTYDDMFTLEVFVWASQPDQTYDEAEARLGALWLPLERILRLDPSLGVTGIVAAVFNNVEGEVGSTTEGYAGLIRADIDVHARISGTPQ